MGTCFRAFDFATDTCSDPQPFEASQKACCCSGNVGAAWGTPCESCPSGDEKIEFCKGAGNPCDIVPDLCKDGYCIADPGHDVKCECPGGLKLIPEHFVCVDVDECTEGNVECPQFSECINTHGSYNCICQDGFTNNGRGGCENVNECIAKPGRDQQKFK